MECMKSEKNKTLVLGYGEKRLLDEYVVVLKRKATRTQVKNKVIWGDAFRALEFMPDNFIDLAFADPPYNITKKFGAVEFKKMGVKSYEEYTDAWVRLLKPKLKRAASVYVCGDWRSSSALHSVLETHFVVRNRITFEREKGRGARTNYKNCSEDIFFCTNSNSYVFNVDAVKVRKKVIAPYKENGGPKDWSIGANGKAYRDTYPSNVWTDITIPFWSMKENTQHPTQKPEKLLAKIILASSNKKDVVFDPFLGSGTTAVVAEKLGRAYCGVEVDKTYCLIAQKRLKQAKTDTTIQGYRNNIFWSRNMLRA